jgi:hypothetical protein
MRTGIAAHLRAERAAARFARTGCAAPVSAAALDPEGMRAAHNTAAAALAAIDALHPGPDTRLRLILAGLLLEIGVHS